MLLIWFLLCLPNPLFKDSYSIVLNDNQGNLLSAKIAKDGQWRFPESETVNPKFNRCILAFEDEYFYKHPGINPFSIWRAIKQNNKAGKVVSGGSTITMQLTRLMRKNQKRTYGEKFIELILALRVELTYSKAAILKLYSSHAPFGTNVVGIEAASWRYFGRNSVVNTYGQTLAMPTVSSDLERFNVYAYEQWQIIEAFLGVAA